jgi:hypothetical protein
MSTSDVLGTKMLLATDGSEEAELATHPSGHRAGRRYRLRAARGLCRTVARLHEERRWHPRL